MLFNSLEYIFFLTIVLSILLIISRRQWIWLLVMSYYFYCSWKFEYLFLLLATTLLNYICAIAISKSRTRGAKKIFLLVGLIGSLGILFTYKYLNFLGGLINPIYSYFGVPEVVPAFYAALPIGISFYTFQALGYTIDVFGGKTKPERHLGIFALFISFFPQLVAGPIERAGNLLAQLKQDRPFDYEKVASGFWLAAWGLFKKIVIADRLAVYVDSVYGHLPQSSGLQLLLAAYFFSFQIYCDFSGYSDIAIGCARMMGYDLRKNFDAPYFSASLPEFWRRWHISLMSWFRDYLYFPLGGSRRGKARKHYNQLIVFLVSGLWHGANLTFLVWGAYHAVLQIVSNLTMPLRQRVFARMRIAPWLVRAGGIFVTFHLVCLGWVFFRAPTINHALRIFQKLTFRTMDVSTMFGPLDSVEFTVALLSIAILLIVELAQSGKNSAKIIRGTPVFVRYPLYVMLILAILLVGVFEEEPFLYFQF